MESPTLRLRRRAIELTAVARLRRGAALLSAVTLCGLLGALALRNALAGGGWGDLSAPAAGAVLAFAAEMLCLDVAIRRFGRRAEPPARADALRPRREASA